MNDKADSVVATSRSPRKKFLSRLALVLSGGIFGLLLAECGFRVFPPPSGAFVLDATLTTYEPRLFQRHPSQINVLTPNVEVELSTLEYKTKVRTNALGLRGSAVEARSDALRILVLGDSFALGLQVEESETWAKLFEKRLSELLGRPVEVLNGGVDGYGTVQAKQQLQRVAASTQVDWAVLGFYLGNDFRDNALLEERRELGRRRHPPAEQPMAAGGGNLWLAKKSRLYAYWLVQKALRARSRDFRIQEYRDEMLPFVNEDDLQRLLPHTQAALHDFQAACQALQIGCSLALLPPAFVVQKNRTEATLNAFGLSLNHRQLVRPAEVVRTLFKDGAVVDLTPALQQESKGTYLHYDPHLNPHGHRVVARELAEQLATVWKP